MAICAAVVAHERPLGGRSALPSLPMKFLLRELQDGCSLTLLHDHRLHCMGCLCLYQTRTVIILNIELCGWKPHLNHKKAFGAEEFVVRDVERFEARCCCAEFSALISRMH